MPGKQSTDQATLPAKVVKQVVSDLDMTKIASALSEGLATKLLESLDMDRLVAAMMTKYGKELEENLIGAIIEKL